MIGPIIFSPGISFAVRTAKTPGCLRAPAVLMARIRACGCGLRRTLTKTMPGKENSSPYLASPKTLLRASVRGIGLPIIWYAKPTLFSSAKFLGRRRDGVHDAHIAGAAA